MVRSKDHQPNIMQLQGKKMKGIADVVFVMDTSGSMSPVIEAVKNHIVTFVDSINSNSQMPIDLRLGLVSHFTDGGDRRGIHHWDFTSSVSDFKQALQSCDKMPASADEFGLPALDRALDFPWRPVSRRFVVSFTDEPVSGGQEADFQRSRLQDLGAKFGQLRVNGYLIGPTCPDYDALGRFPRMIRVVLPHQELATYDFGRFLSDLGRTVSQSSEQQAPSAVSQNLYGI
jgi:hypothetical protein